MVSLIECVPNFSEGRRQEVVAEIVLAISQIDGVTLLDLDVAGPVWLLVVVEVADAVLGTALGLFVSAFARTEFQAVQFMPLFVVPQILLCGLFVPRSLLPDVLRQVSDALPLSYAVDAMKEIAGHGSAVAGDLTVVVAFAVVALGLGAVTLRRRTP